MVCWCHYVYVVFIIRVVVIVVVICVVCNYNFVFDTCTGTVRVMVSVVIAQTKC